MLYGQIITFLFVLLLMYYAGMIVMDLHKAKKMKELEAEKVSENDIDISDEAKNFKTILISREEPQRQSVNSKPTTEKVRTRIPKEPSMTGAVPVEELASKITNCNGTLPDDLGNILHKCQAA